MKGSGAAFAAFCAALLLPICADAEQIDASQFSRTFNIAFPGYSETTTLTDFPALVRLSPDLNDFRYDKCAANGGDLRFADSDGNLLAHEIDTWNENGTSLVWVKVPSLNSATVIRAYYGYKGAGSPPAVTASDVWSNGYLGVWHFGDDGLTQSDSTANGKSLVGTQSSHIESGVAGIVGNGVDNAVQAPTAYKGGFGTADPDNMYSSGKTLTFEMWACQREVVNDKYMVTKKLSSTAYSARLTWPIYGGDYTKIQQNYSVAMTNLTTETGSGYGNAKYQIPTNDVTASWLHYALVVDNEERHKVLAYHDGVLKQNQGISDADQTICAVGGNLTVGNSGVGGTQAFPGVIDEVRVSGVARSADWLKATYETITDEGFAYYEMSNDWTKYARKIKVAFTNDMAATLTDFPVLVRLSTSISGFNYAHFAKPNGGDLRFADANGNLLASEIDTWDENGESLVWVKVPVLQKGTEITAYYGWVWAPAVDAKAVWANGYIGVWHLNESGFTMADSTQGGVDFTCESAFADYVGRGVGGLVGNAVEFDLVVDGADAHKGHLYLKDSNSRYCGRSTMTIEYWVYQRHAASNRRLLYCKTGYNRAYDVYCTTSSYDGCDKYSYVFGTTNTTTSVTNNPVTSVNVYDADFLTWKHHSVVFDSETAKNFTLYVDGGYRTAKAVGENDIMLPSVKDLRLGNLGGGQAFPGKFDEMRISSVARSAAWLKTTHDTVMDDTFATYGAAKDNGTRGFSVIVR